MDQSDEKVICKYADKFVALANEISEEDNSGRVGMAIRYAAIRYSISEAATQTDMKEDVKNKELPLLADELIKDLQFNLEDFVKILSWLNLRREDNMAEKKSWDDIPSLNMELDDTTLTEEEKEARRHPRTDQNALTRLLFGDNPFPIRVLTTSKGEFEGMILDVSKSGVRLASPKSLEKGERVKVSFSLSNRNISVKAVTCWVGLESNGFNIGLEFLDLPANIAEFIDSLNTANLLDRVGKLKEGSSKNRT